MSAQTFASVAAIHEAGHAVVAHGLDLDVHAAVLGNGEIEGAVLIETQADERLSNDGRIALNVAGYAAEHVFAKLESDVDGLYESEKNTLDRYDAKQLDIHRAHESAMDEYGDSVNARKAIRLAWDRVLAWQRHPNIANAIMEIALRLDANRKVGIVNRIAERHQVPRPDPRLLPIDA